MVTETKERMKEMWDEAVEAVLEKAKDLGIRGVEEFVTLNANSDKVYNTYVIPHSVLKKLLSGKIRNIKQLQDLEWESHKDYESYMKESKYHILYKYVLDSKINDEIVLIETIFIK